MLSSPSFASFTNNCKVVVPMLMKRAAVPLVCAVLCLAVAAQAVEVRPLRPLLLKPTEVLPSRRTVAENAVHNKRLCQGYLQQPYESIGKYDLFQNGFSEAGQDRFVSELFGRRASGSGRTVWRHRLEEIVSAVPENARLDKNGRWARPFAGFFVEVGSHDGETHSNTWLFENCLQWTGILVEPRSFSQSTSQKWRPNSIHYPVAITNAPAPESCTVEGVGITTCVGLQHLLDLHQVDMVDYLSVDVGGGGELAVLRSLDLDKTLVNVISVFEQQQEAAAIADLLQQAGFELVGRVLTDAIYVHEDFVPVRVPGRS